VVIGALDGQFRDNAKYFFLHAQTVVPEVRTVFVTERADTAGLLANYQYTVLRYPTLKSVWLLVRCNVAVVDESSWFRHGRRFLLTRTHVVQLWHGVGCKRIELDRWRNETGRFAWVSSIPIVWLRLIAYRITGRWVRYAMVTCTSRFYRDNVFRQAFHSRSFPITGYPRNDFALSLHGSLLELAWSNVDAGIKARLGEWERLGRKLVLVAPTFRDSGSVPMQLNETTLTAIDTFAEAHAVEFVFKFHPSERNIDHLSGRHFHVCARDSDIYPLFPCAAALVTDYSSVSMDFLLVERPLIFLIPDNDNYIKRDRQLQFDPYEMMPGPRVTNWYMLFTTLLSEFARDKYAAERAALRSQAFDGLPQSEAVPKIIALMRQQGWIVPDEVPMRRHS
jgi:CDP-glycerol glycerophosphotransferase (TagB/SpsB family)